MRRKSFETLQSSTARSVGSAGKWWRILSLRDRVATRFDRLQASLDSALNHLLAPEGGMIVDAMTGAVADRVLVDRATLYPLRTPGFRTVPDPAAIDDARKRHAARVGAASSAAIINRRTQGPAGGDHV